MPRPQRPLNPEAGPVQAFAAELRRVREKAGNPKYLQMARATGRSRTALSEAAGGDHLASWETVEAYLTACGQDPAPWRPLWDTVHAQARPSNSQTPGPAPAAGPLAGSPQPQNPPRHSRVRWLAAAAAGLAGTVIAIVMFAVPGAGQHGEASAHAPAATRPPGSAVIVVQNKVAIGPSTLTEDVTPAYLSTQTHPACAENDCMVHGTRMWSGTILYATCQVRGTPMTNKDQASPGIQRNPGGVASPLWYYARTRTGRTGYISEVYLTPASRGGLHLPHCAQRASP